MIEKGLILTGDDAELLSCALEEVKTKVYAIVPFWLSSSTQ
jgi:hypothetical protein